jgi:hypothetical protein
LYDETQEVGAYNAAYPWLLLYDSQQLVYRTRW